MKITFDFTIDDWMEFNKIFLSQSKQYKIWNIAGVISFPIGFFVVLVYRYLTAGFFHYTLLLGLIVLSVLWMYFYNKYYWSHILKISKKMIESGDNSSILGLHEIELSNDNLNVKEPESESRIKWSGLTKLEETDRYMFLYNTAVSAHVIPKFKVKENTTKEEAFEFIREKLANK